MTPKKKSPFWPMVKGLVGLFYGKTKVVGVEHLPQEACIVVGNHAQMHGPIACELNFPGKRYTWCAGQMMHLKDVPAYAFQDFWSYKPRWCRWFYKLLSYLIAPLSVFVFNNADTIGVYRDNRILTTFKQTVRALQDGAGVVIFPEHDVPHNHILCDFQDRFIDVAKLYYKQSGKEVSFVPMYLAPRLKTMYLGKPIRFSADAPIETERQKIKEYLMQEITEIACSLPPHTVVPYRNIPKKQYPTNLSIEVKPHEKTSC